MSTTVELYLIHGRVDDGIVLDADGEEIARITSTQTHARTFWSGFAVEEAEYSSVDTDGAFRWRLYAERRGLRTGMTLSFARDDETQARWADLEDRRWTVGTIGRGDVKAPDWEREGDLRTLFIYPDGAGALHTIRLLIDDVDGELWGTVEPTPGRNMHRILRWDGRVLGTLALSEGDETGMIFEVGEGDGELDALETALCEVIGVVLVGG